MMTQKPIALVEKLGSKEQKVLNSMLIPDENVIVALKGRSNQVLVATTRRVIIIKSGIMAGVTFGNKNTSYDLVTITSIEVQMHMMSGTVELSTEGMQGFERTKSNSYEAPNCIPIGREHLPQFQEAVRVIQQLVQEARIPQVQQKDEPIKASATIPEQIQQLAALYQAGVLTNEEFTSKKTELLARL